MMNKQNVLQLTPVSKGSRKPQKINKHTYPARYTPDFLVKTAEIIYVVTRAGCTPYLAHHAFQTLNKVTGS